MIEAVDDDPVSRCNQSLRLVGSYERARLDIFHAGLLSKDLGEHALSETGVAQDHDRFTESRNLVLADGILPALSVLVG